MAQILPGVNPDVANHKNSSADWKNLGLTLGQLSFWQWLTPSKSEKSAVPVTCTWLKYCQEIGWLCGA